MFIENPYQWGVSYDYALPLSENTLLHIHSHGAIHTYKLMRMYVKRFSPEWNSISKTRTFFKKIKSFSRKITAFFLKNKSFFFFFLLFFYRCREFVSYHSVEVSPPFMRILTRKKLENALLYTKLERSIKREYIADSKHIM